MTYKMRWMPSGMKLCTCISVICHVMCIGPFWDQPFVSSWFLSCFVFTEDKGFQDCFWHNLNKRLISFENTFILSFCPHKRILNQKDKSLFPLSACYPHGRLTVTGCSWGQINSRNEKRKA